ncbi:hypothetical protein VTL71DRAFT_10433 [Oculimacula yallundae]|uniref:Uncharacterized protein n=1 Tax=Oculimacula yallundae TaxID=86028 RepID=A0ABR4CT88_9HELO
MSSATGRELGQIGATVTSSTKQQVSKKRRKRKRNGVAVPSETITDDGSSEENNYNPGSKSGKELCSTLASLVGNIESLDQVSAASHWLTSLGCSKEDSQRFACFQQYATKLGVSKVWPDIIMYRSTGQITTYFLDGQRLRGGKGRAADLEALDDLEIIAVGWTRLSAEGRLSRLEQRLGYEDGEGRYESHAARLRAFLRARKASEGFQRWNADEMKLTRYEIYQAFEEDEIEGVESEASSVSKPDHQTGADKSSDEAFLPVLIGQQSDVPLRSGTSKEPARNGSIPSDSSNEGDTNPQENNRDVYERLKTSVLIKKKALEEAKANAKAARTAHESVTDWNEILRVLQSVVKDAREENEEWTVESARALAQGFAQLGPLASDSVEQGLVEPLAVLDKAEKELEWARKRLADFTLCS